VSQCLSPILLKVRLADGWNLGFVVGGIALRGRWRDSPEISGLKRFEIPVTHTMADGQFVFPRERRCHGKTKLNARARAIPWLAADFLNFPVKNPGEGLEVFGEVGVALPTSRMGSRFRSAQLFHLRSTLRTNDDRE